jgi:hypothetical protein
MILFTEGNTPFNPLCFASHFNHIFVVIRVDPSSTPEKRRYRMVIANKTGVDPYPPFLPDPPIFDKDDYFRDFLLVKLINAERASMHGPEFKPKLMRTARETLEEVSKQFQHSIGKKKRPKKASVALPNLVISEPSLLAEHTVTKEDLLQAQNDTPSSVAAIVLKNRTPMATQMWQATEPLGKLSNSNGETPAKAAVDEKEGGKKKRRKQ